MKAFQILAILFATIATAQDYQKSLFTPVYANYAFVSFVDIEAGAMIGTTIKDRYTISVFGGHGFRQNSNSYGGYFRGILTNNKYWDVGISLKGGIYNGKAAVWFPSLETLLRINKNLRIELAGTAYSGFPAGEFRIVIGNFKDENGN